MPWRNLLFSFKNLLRNDFTKILFYRLPVAKEWQQRSLKSIYTAVFLDAIHYHVRSEDQVIKKVVYIAIGIDLDGKNDVLGICVGENETVEFCATVLNSLMNRSFDDIFIACTYNLTGFSAAFEVVFPKLRLRTVSFTNCATPANTCLTKT